MKHHHPCGVKWRGRKSGGSFLEIRNRETALKASRKFCRHCCPEVEIFRQTTIKFFKKRFWYSLILAKIPIMTKDMPKTG